MSSTVCCDCEESWLFVRVLYAGHVQICLESVLVLCIGDSTRTSIEGILLGRASIVRNLHAAALVQGIVEEV